MFFTFFSSDLFNLILCLLLAAAAHFGVSRYLQYGRTEQKFMHYGILFGGVAMGVDLIFNDLLRRVLLIDQVVNYNVMQKLTLISYLAVKLFVVALLFRTFFALRKIRKAPIQN